MSSFCRRRKTSLKKMSFGLGLVVLFSSCVGTIVPVFTVEPNEPADHAFLQTNKGRRHIHLRHIHPKKELFDRLNSKDPVQAEKDYSGGIIPFSQSNGAVDLGMNDVPVLDQGQYGTCVTFSTTANLDALLNIGDFIDQQCILELNTGLGNNYWNGADDSTQIIAPLKQYGLVQKGKCDNLYPQNSAALSTAAYENIASKTVTASNVQFVEHSTIDLQTLKSILDKGHRVTIGIMLLNTPDPISVQGFNINIAGQQDIGGLWACSQAASSSNFCAVSNSGHEVVVIGYDDKQELLKIRNSWSEEVGDAGDFYMTYDFFSVMALDATEIFVQ